MKNRRKNFFLIFIVLIISCFILFVLFTLFFDQAVIVRHNTVYHVPTDQKVIALTFDDGPSPRWTPQLLKELKDLNVKATFFVIGKHVRDYPDIARQIVQQGCEIGNHGYNHKLAIFESLEELEDQIQHTQRVIFEVTGVKTILFRPPKAWLTDVEKLDIKQLGYKTVLWTLNSKDWVTFDDKFIVKYIVAHVKPGDIILFHDSGGIFGTEGGNREETIKSVKQVVERLSAKGYKFVTVSELLALQ